MATLVMVLDYVSQRQVPDGWCMRIAKCLKDLWGSPDLELWCTGLALPVRRIAGVQTHSQTFLAERALPSPADRPRLAGGDRAPVCTGLAAQHNRPRQQAVSNLVCKKSR